MSNKINKKSIIKANEFMKCKLNKCYKQIIASDILITKIYIQKNKYITKMMPKIDKLYENNSSMKKSNVLKINKYNKQLEKYNNLINTNKIYKRSLECVYKNCYKNLIYATINHINIILSNTDKKNKKYKTLKSYKKLLKSKNVSLNKINKIIKDLNDLNYF